jgi:hypothetical protein
VEVKQGFFLKRASTSSLDIQPLFMDAPSDDPDYGISVIN